MKIHVLQHVAFEGPGMIADWVSARGHTLATCKLYEANILPSLDAIDMLVIMGGPMGVYEADKYSWLANEISFIQQAIDANKKVIGVCLGSQLIAAALGAKVYPHGLKEIGWFPVAIPDSAIGHPLVSGLNPAMQVLHWHGDTFDLPVGVQLLMVSQACENQAFAYRKNVLGLQFHLEMDESGIENILNHCSAEIVVPSTTIQPAEKIREGTRHIPSCQRVLYGLLDRLSA